MVEQILTSRYYKNGNDYDIVYEWEDILAKELAVPIVSDNKELRSKYFFIKFPFLAKILQTFKNSFLFTMLPLGNPPGNNKSNIITCIIDFFLRDDESLNNFYKTYSNNPIILISSKEAYDFLISKGCPLNIQHWALSISDKYKISSDTYFNKKYDVVMVGRQNAVLMTYLENYAETHPEFTYVYRKLSGKTWQYYSNDGTCLGELKTRDEYMSLLRQSRIGLYATPGMDGARSHTNGFNQVTPRFLEYIAAGCHIVARYADNSDTDYYELNSFCKSIETYDDFEARIEYALTHKVDMDKYAKYLEKHYTSKRAQQLKNIISL